MIYFHCVRCGATCKPAKQLLLARNVTAFGEPDDGALYLAGEEASQACKHTVPRTTTFARFASASCGVKLTPRRTCSWYCAYTYGMTVAQDDIIPKRAHSSVTLDLLRSITLPFLWTLPNRHHLRRIAHPRRTTTFFAFFFFACTASCSPYRPRRRRFPRRFSRTGRYGTAICASEIGPTGRWASAETRLCLRLSGEGVRGVGFCEEGKGHAARMRGQSEGELGGKMVAWSVCLVWCVVLWWTWFVVWSNGDVWVWFVCLRTR